MALIELGTERTLRADELHDRHRLSPYVGRRLRAKVRTTLLRGQVIYRDARIVGAPRGRLLRPRD